MYIYTYIHILYEIICIHTHTYIYIGLKENPTYIVKYILHGYMNTWRQLPESTAPYRSS